MLDLSSFGIGKWKGTYTCAWFKGYKWSEQDNETYVDCEHWKIYFPELKIKLRECSKNECTAYLYSAY